MSKSSRPSPDCPHRDHRRRPGTACGRKSRSYKTPALKRLFVRPFHTLPQSGVEPVDGFFGAASQLPSRWFHARLWIAAGALGGERRRATIHRRASIRHRSTRRSRVCIRIDGDGHAFRAQWQARTGPSCGPADRSTESAFQALRRRAVPDRAGRRLVIRPVTILNEINNLPLTIC